MKRRLALLLALCLLLLPWIASCDKGAEYGEVPAGEVYVHFLDVGQADCTLIRTRTTTVLVDAGGGDTAEDVLDYLREIGIRTVDCLILTHPHSDHIGGAPRLLAELEIKTCVLPNRTVDTELFLELLGAIRAEETTLLEGYRRDPIQCGDLTLELLWPPPYPEAGSENDAGIILRLAFGKNTVLFTGDASSTVEERILRECGSEGIRAQVLKVGHHGARSSTSESFLSAVSPRYAVISCGRGNAYGYPDAALMARLMSFGTRTLRTDTDGTVVLCGDGTDFWILG